MSKAPDEATNIPPTNTGLGLGWGSIGIPLGGHLPQSAQNQTSSDVSNFSDGSWRIFSMYLERAKEEDEKTAESWQADANGILVFTGLFSAAVASLISVSIQDIRQNPQDTSNFYLAGIYQSLANPNRSNVSLPASPPPFTPPTFAVWVNTLWFLSLAISLTSALLATLLQQWARRYLKVTQTHYSLHKRARIRAFFAEGVDKSFLPLAVDTLPVLVHVSLFLFFAGLVVFLWNVNLTIFKSVLSWVSLCLALYGCVTIIPIYRHDSPYFTPLTALMRYAIAVPIFVFLVLYLCFCALVYCCSCCFCCNSPHLLGEKFLNDPLVEFLETTFLTPDEAAPKSPSEIDTRAFMWTFDRLDEDRELVGFFLGVPGFHSSNVTKEPLRSLNDAQRRRLLDAMIGLLDRTYSSDLLSDQVKRHRDDICANAVDLVDTPKAFQKVLTILTSSVPAPAVEIAQFVKRWGNRQGDDTVQVFVRAISTFVVAKAQRHNNSWFILASEELGVPEPVLRKHAAHGDSLSLAILIYVVRQQFTHHQKPSYPEYQISLVLKAVCKFNAQDTSPDLQHDFCALWNQVVQTAQRSNNAEWWMTNYILRLIRNIYLVLHQDTNSAPTRFSASTREDDRALNRLSSYPVCNVAGHMHDDPASTAFVHTVPHNSAELVPASLAGPHASSSVPNALPVDRGLTTMSPLDDFHPAQTTTETLGMLTAPDATTADELDDIVTSGIRMPYPSPEASTSAPPPFTSPPAAVTLQDSSDTLTSSETPNLPLSANPGHNNTLPIESHCSITVPASPSSSPGLTPAPDLGTATEDGGGAEPDLRKENDALGPPSVNRTIDSYTMVTPDLPPQSPPSLPLVTDPDIAIADRSQWDPNAEHSADCPSHPSPHQYDMV